MLGGEMIMNNCPCCSAQLLAHIRDKRVCWFCSRCRQDMPVKASNRNPFRQEFSFVNPLNDILSHKVLKTAD